MSDRIETLVSSTDYRLALERIATLEAERSQMLAGVYGISKHVDEVADKVIARVAELEAFTTQLCDQLKICSELLGRSVEELAYRDFVKWSNDAAAVQRDIDTLLERKT